MAKSSNNLRRVLGNILLAEPLYVTGTGTKVLVTSIDYTKGQKEVLARVKFLDIPDKKTIMKCEQFQVDVREPRNGPSVNLGGQPTQSTQNYEIRVDSAINLDNLSTTPYETRAAKILYKKC